MSLRQEFRKECLLYYFKFCSKIYFPPGILPLSKSWSGRCQRSDDVGQGHLSISHYKGFKLRDPLVIGRAGPTSEKNSLKCTERKGRSVAQGLVLFPSTPLHQNLLRLPLQHILRARGTGRSYWWSRRPRQSVLRYRGTAMFFRFRRKGCGRMCQTIDKARVFYWEGLSVNILMALGSSFCKSVKSVWFTCKNIWGDTWGRWTGGLWNWRGKKGSRRKRNQGSKERRVRERQVAERVPCLRC